MRPNAPLALNNRGTLYMRQGALQSALDDFNAAVNANPNLYLARINRGHVLTINRDYDSALAVVYYAGHGLEIGGVNYLVPVDARLAVDKDAETEAVADACRDNPFAPAMQRTIALKLVDKGLSDIEPSSGFMVVYAAKHGETALDGEGIDSPFAIAVARDVKEPHVEVRKLFDIIRDDVWNSTKHEQQPFIYGSPPGREDFYFVAGK
jgi:uncharacterized caspase-like protein